MSPYTDPEALDALPLPNFAATSLPRSQCALAKKDQTCLDKTSLGTKFFSMVLNVARTAADVPTGSQRSQYQHFLRLRMTFWQAAQCHESQYVCNFAAVLPPGVNSAPPETVYTCDFHDCKFHQWECSRNRSSSQRCKYLQEVYRCMHLDRVHSVYLVVK